MESQLSSTAETIAEIMSQRNLMWSIGGVRKVPTADDVRAVLDRGLLESINQDSGDENETVNIVLTHLLFRRQAGATRVYLDMGVL